MTRARVQRKTLPPPLAPRVASPWLRAGAVRTTAWGLALTAAEAVIASVLAQNTIAAAILQAGAVEWGTHRAGVVWSAAPGSTQTAAGWARRAGAGAACGVAVAVLAVAASLASGDAVLTDGRVSVEVLAVGLGMAAVEAVRDELLLRGLVLRLTEGILPAGAGIGACAVAGACARFGADGHVTAALLFEAVRAGALAAVWIYDRGAWVAVGANTGFAWTAASLAGAGVIGARSPRPVIEGGPAIAVVTAAFLVASAAALGMPARLQRSKSVRPDRTEPSN
jgi:hypothetical protein